MSVFSKKQTPEEKKALENAYIQWQNEKIHPLVAKIIGLYARAATIVFFALVLLEYYIDLGAFYLIFPVFFGVHLLLVLLFPACFSLLPSYGKPKNEKESYPVGIFLMIPSIFPIFYLIRGASPKLWLAGAVGAILVGLLLVLRYRMEIRARFSFSILYEYFLIMMAVFGMLVMTNSLVAERNMIEKAPVTVIEKQENKGTYAFTVSDADGEELRYNVTAEAFGNTEAGETVYIETYEGLFGIRFTKLTTDPET
jgi:hypothetical protein